LSSTDDCEKTSVVLRTATVDSANESKGCPQKSGGWQGGSVGSGIEFV
jgi:hypothetical protein